MIKFYPQIDIRLKAALIVVLVSTGMLLFGRTTEKSVKPGDKPVQKQEQSKPKTKKAAPAAAAPIGKFIFLSKGEIAINKIKGVSGATMATDGTFYLLPDLKVPHDALKVYKCKIEDNVFTRSFFSIEPEPLDIKGALTELTDGEAIRYDPDKMQFLLSFEGCKSCKSITQPTYAYMNLDGSIAASDVHHFPPPFNYNAGPSPTLKDNRAMEGVSLAKNGDIWFINEIPMSGETKVKFKSTEEPTDKYMRLSLIDKVNGSIKKQFAYLPDKDDDPKNPRRVPEILNIDDDNLLVIESNLKGRLLIYKVALNDHNTTNIMNKPESFAGKEVIPLTKQLLKDLSADPNLKSISGDELNVEAVCWGMPLLNKHQSLICFTDNTDGSTPKGNTHVMEFEFDPTLNPSKDDTTAINSNTTPVKPCECTEFADISFDKAGPGARPVETDAPKPKFIPYTLPAKMATGKKYDARLAARNALPGLASTQEEDDKKAIEARGVMDACAVKLENAKTAAAKLKADPDALTADKVKVDAALYAALDTLRDARLQAANTSDEAINARKAFNEQQNLANNGKNNKIKNNNIKAEDVASYTFQLDTDGMLKSTMPEYFRVTDTLSFNLNNIKVENVKTIYHQMDSVNKALSKSCTEGTASTQQCCFNDYKGILETYTSGRQIACSGCCETTLPDFIPDFRETFTNDTIYKDELVKIVTEDDEHKLTDANGSFNVRAFTRYIGSDRTNIKWQCLEIDTQPRAYMGKWLGFKLLVRGLKVYKMRVNSTDATGADNKDITILIPVHQFEKMDSLMAFSKTVSLTIKQQNKLLFQGNLTEDSLKGIVISDFLKDHHASYSPRQGIQVSFAVKAPNVRNQLIDAYLKYLKKKDVGYFAYNKVINISALQILKAVMDSIFNTRILAQSMVDNPATGTCKDCLSPLSMKLNNDLDTFMEKNSAILYLADKIICKNRPWLRATAWIGNKVQMNPLGVFDTATLATHAREIQTRFTLQQAFVASLTSRLQTGIRDKRGVIEFLKLQRDTAENVMFNLQNLSDSLQKQVKAAPTDVYTAKDKIYYQGNMLVSTYGTIYLLRTHNAGKPDFLKFDNLTMPFTNDRYEKNEKVRYQVYNIPASSKIQVTNTVTDAAADVNILEDAFVSSSAAGTVQPADIFQSYPLPLAERNGSNDLVNCFMKYYGEVAWLSQQTTPVYTTSLPGKAEGPAFTDSLIDGNSLQKSPAQIGYRIKLMPPKGDTLVSDSFSYHVYRKQYIQLTFGVGYVPGSSPDWAGRSTSTYNAATATFSKTFLNPVDVVYGVKIFPFGINVRRWWPAGDWGSKHYRNLLFARGDHAANRFYLLVSASLSQKQLFNFYLGPGYEIIPGLGFTMGCNLYNSNRYIILNNAVESFTQVPKPALYFGITIDPLVFLQVGNVFGINY